MAIEIREGQLPGIGTRWELPAAGGRTVMLVIHRQTGRRHLSIGSPGRDEPDCSIELSSVEATALGGLLTGARVVREGQWRTTGRVRMSHGDRNQPAGSQPTHKETTMPQLRKRNRIRRDDRRAETRTVIAFLVFAAVFVAIGLLVESPRLGLVVALLMVMVAAAVGVSSRWRPRATSTSDAPRLR